MYRRLYAQCDLDVQITAQSALLVQGTQAPEGAGTFYRARDPTDGRERFCIPATTLKGVWRSAAERILRSFEPWLACDPFEVKKGDSQSCSKRLEGSLAADSPQAYGAMCPVCRLFGSTAHAGLLQLQDAWAMGNPRPEPQTGIAIDRFTGGVKYGALYSYEPLPAGTRFTTHVTVHNVEFWQLGLLALVSREMSQGRVRIGSGTRKGLGHVEVVWTRAEFRYPKELYEQASVGQAGVLVSAQALAVDGDRVNYPDAEPWLLPGLRSQPANDWADALWTSFWVTENDLSRLQIDCVERALAPKLRLGRAGFAYGAPAQTGGG
ncbi:MAG: RAMP superfamily CRISPR-associated protein [Anaerolineae bacterium]|nr:RAMP superfamily CRISPR-associated protein [Anaerolineae bacterium]